MRLLRGVMHGLSGETPPDASAPGLREQVADRDLLEPEVLRNGVPQVGLRVPSRLAQHPPHSAPRRTEALSQQRVLTPVPRPLHARLGQGSGAGASAEIRRSIRIGQGCELQWAQLVISSVHANKRYPVI